MIKAHRTVVTLTTHARITNQIALLTVCNFSFNRKRRGGSKSTVNKEECAVECKWISCHAVFQSVVELSDHVRTAHVEPMSTHDVFVCLWEGCKVFDKPSLSHSWLSKHVNAHTGVKPFKCMISGCSMTFSSREGLARHVPSHFNDTKPTKRQKSENDSSPKKVMKKKKKKMRILRQAKPPAQGWSVCYNQHLISEIFYRFTKMHFPGDCFHEAFIKSPFFDND